MKFDKTDEKSIINFIHELLDYYAKIDNHSKNIIYTSDSLPLKNNMGWYHYTNNEHQIHINVQNILALKRKIINVNEFYAFIAICVTHEFRHFLQARYIKDGVKLEGYNKRDILATESLLYIKLFFDRYYILNKGFIKMESDADKFAIENAFEFLNKYYPEIEAEKSIINAVNYYAYLQKQEGIALTVPAGRESVEDILYTLDYYGRTNLRIPDLNRTLVADSSINIAIQEYLGLDTSKLLTEELINKYNHMKSGTRQDLLVAESIIEVIDKKEKSLESFPTLKNKILVNKKTY